MWQTLTEAEIREGSKRILEFYPLGNTPLRSLFPILSRCAPMTSGWKSWSCWQKHRKEAQSERPQDQSRPALQRRTNTPAVAIDLPEVEKQMKQQQELQRKIAMPELLKKAIKAENTTLNQIIRHYVKKWEGTDPVKD